MAQHTKAIAMSATACRRDVLIKDADVDFHEPDAGDPTWSETNYFAFYERESNLNIGVYALFRTNLGTVGSTVCMNSGRSLTPWEGDFCDMRSSLPIPEPYNLRDYRLLNSLHVRCIEPNRVWEIGYDDGEGTSIDVRWDALMPGFDVHDPAEDPMAAAAQHADADGKFAWGTAYNGHFDQTGRAVGNVSVRGRTHAIDCVSTMDHSWGPRAERGAPTMSWLGAHFSNDFAMHAIFSFDPSEHPSQLRLTHGYVLERGDVFGLKAGSGIAVRRSDRYADTIDLTLVDRNDRPWKMSATGLTTFPWLCWPNMVGFNVLARWECGDAVGYGEIYDFYELPLLTDLNASPATRVLARPPQVAT